ncbi:MAG: DUF3014 domain-containing protein [Pseudohongiella sp.]|nr:DUF3014 domain-containing protein [Pseudohongiella sp.]MDO9520385.1 DUF3014 domain-containing protein [Pseudohongiella sp.]MDP2126606.1 DUF3014 domain-containing protein [Pseudohongiella sp.]
MAHKTLAIIAALSLIGVAFLVYLALTFEPPEGTRSVALDTPVPRPVEQIVPVTPPVAADPTPTEPAAPLVSVPVTQEPVVTEESLQPLPTLNDSDAFVVTRLAEMEMGASLLRMLAPEDLVRKFVVFVTNVADGELPQMEYPLRRIESEFATREIAANLFEMTPATHTRFTPMVDMLVTLDPQQGVAIYRALRPLFQEAYAELGYQGSFDAVLVRAIDQIMNAQLETGPFQLIKPSVMFLYAEGRIEDLPPVQKQLLRLGPENTAKLQAVLPAYRERLQAGR